MKTPYGKECKYYFADYVRGRATAECRLLENNPDSEPWFPSLCQTCPVPDILMANQCPHLRLYGRIGKTLFGLSRKVGVEGFCDRHFLDVPNPRVGCGNCHTVELDLIEVSED